MERNCQGCGVAAPVAAFVVGRRPIFWLCLACTTREVIRRIVKAAL